MKPAVIDRPGRRRGLALVAALVQLAGLAGCFVDVDLGGARLSCNDGQCPSGFECVDMRCVEGEGGGDDGDGADAAPQADADPVDPDAAVTDDAAPPDAAPPDAPLPSACDEQYGKTPGYQLCEETPDSCEFFVNTEIPAACSAHCAAFGGTCLAGRNDVPEDVCSEGGEDLGCDAAKNNTLVCTCSLGRGQ
jgi:hypothetical protein